MPSSILIFDIEVDAPEAGGPYQIMILDENDHIVAFFVVKVKDTGDILEDWAPIPLPKPFARDDDLLSTFALSLYQKGYEFIPKNDITIH